MARQRERFERTDVPRDNPHRNTIAAVVLVVVFVAVGVVVSIAWRRAQAQSHLGDSSLSSSVSKTSTVSDLGYTVSSDSFMGVLLLTTDNLDASETGGANLSSAELLVYDETAATGKLVSIPTDVKVSYNGQDTTLAELFNSSGSSACVSPLSTAANLPVTHVIVSTSEVWDEVRSLSGAGVNSLISRASDFLSSIRTDMSSQDILDLAEKVQSAGTDGLAKVDAPVVDETTTDENGNAVSTGYRVIDQASLGLAVGTLVSNEG